MTKQLVRKQLTELRLTDTFWMDHHGQWIIVLPFQMKIQKGKMMEELLFNIQWLLITIHATEDDDDDDDDDDDHHHHHHHHHHQRVNTQTFTICENVAV